MKETKERFQQEFQDGVLHDLWNDIRQGDEFLARWAGHRMAVALKAVDSIASGNDLRALDIGIGSGSLIHELSNRGCRVFGTDFSKSIVRKARERLTEVRSDARGRIMLADVEMLPSKTDAFDLVTCLGVLEYLSDDDRALREIFRVLRPGGHLVLAVASYHRLGSLTPLAYRKIVNATGRLYRDGCRETEGGHPGDGTTGPQVRLIKPSVLRRNARKTGFAIQDFKCFGGKVFGRYVPFRFFIPGVIYIGDHCLMVLKKPV